MIFQILLNKILSVKFDLSEGFYQIFSKTFEKQDYLIYCLW
jgi:hypothetical protein